MVGLTSSKERMFPIFCSRLFPSKPAFETAVTHRRDTQCAGMIQIHGGNFNLENIQTKLGSHILRLNKNLSDAYKFIHGKSSYLVENLWFPELIVHVANNARDRVPHNKRKITTQHLYFTVFCRISNYSKFLFTLSIVTSDAVTGCNGRNIQL